MFSFSIGGENRLAQAHSETYRREDNHPISNPDLYGLKLQNRFTLLIDRTLAFRIPFASMAEDGYECGSPVPGSIQAGEIGNNLHPDYFPGPYMVQLRGHDDEAVGAAKSSQRR